MTPNPIQAMHGPDAKTTTPSGLRLSHISSPNMLRTNPVDQSVSDLLGGSLDRDIIVSSQGTVLTNPQSWNTQGRGRGEGEGQFQSRLCLLVVLKMTQASCCLCS